MALSFTFALTSGCVHYKPKPLAPAQNISKLESRTLADEGLRAFIGTNAPEAAKAWPRLSWDLSALTLVAFYYHPSLDVARANVGVTEAGVITAGGRPNPSVNLSPEYTINPDAGMSPWLLGLNFDLPIETSGKRGYRIAHAKQLTEAARLQVAETGWKVRSGVRTALLEYLLTQREIELLQTEITARSNVVQLMGRRFAVGEVSRTEVDATRTQLVQARVGLRAAEGRVQESRVAIATALGVPPSTVESARFDWPDLEKLPSEETLSVESVQSAGLLNRLDVRRALADYAAAERALQLEIAKQYPDVHLRPGYTFDQGEHQFAFGLSVELPVLNQNQGPIAEAKARREKAAADFLALQAQVIGELHKSRAQYQAALAELKEVETSLTELQDRREKLAQHAVELGEADRLALASVQLQRLVVARARLDALRRAQTALGALEDAVQRPLAPATALPAVPLTNLREAKESK
jgi:outer membrane protein TolC